ncbi:MAG: sensor histidine kinase [Clostridium argentinense]|uniref:histidine kinase n=1 Tax=Clostridium faecium TaxID=2762223 RepID=A0ABR8YNR3_9CLOT|nr:MULTISPECIES: sensor histidine kinase [Clostridium]MBD8045886.1 sensor histidine kinase [Clostridium faecium]MBS5824209.1 sensor histidine kinase [Clostridium argentinense]
MFRKVQQQKYMIFLRYGYILLFLLSFGKGYKNIGSIEIIFLLTYIINNQLRFFILPEENTYIVPSLIFEILLGYKLYILVGNFGGLIFVLSLIDIIYMFKKVHTLIYILGITILIITQKNLELLISWLIAALPIFLLLAKVKDEEGRKLEAQNLYDKLRGKDEELKRVNKELEVYANTIEEITILRERNRISREIHDNVGHALSTIIIQLGAIEKICKSDGEAASIMAKNLGGFAKESMERVRGAVRAMKPREFEEYEGVIAVSEMIKNFQKLTGVEVKLRVSDSVWKLNSDQTMVIYRIIQEFLSNAVRHGKSTEVKIFLNFLETHLRVHLKDNGVGCSKVIPGIELQSIKERVATWGGNIEYFAKEGQGFELVVTMDKVKLSLDGV